VVGTLSLFLHNIKYRFSLKKSILNDRYIVEDIFVHSDMSVAEGKSELSFLRHKWKSYNLVRLLK
jgi:hypothetical protein